MTFLTSLELSLHCFRGRAGRFSLQPVARTLRVEQQLHAVIPRHAPYDRDRREDAVEEHSHYHRVNDPAQQQRDIRPDSIRYVEQGWAKQRNQKQASGQNQRPRPRLLVMPQRKEGHDAKKYAEYQTEGSIR